MLEAKHRRVQRLSPESFSESAQRLVFGRFPIERIAEQRRAVVCEVHADVYGARLSVTAEPPPGASGEPASCDASGRVSWAGLEGAFPELCRASTAAAASGMLAVTLEDSHVVFVLGRPELPAP